MSSIINSDAGDSFVAYHGDTVDVSASLPDNSVDFSIFSPPFSSLFVYSASDRDMGNVRNDAEFFAHYSFLAKQQLRVMKPGRLIAVHCMLLPASKQHDGFIGLKDFRGDLIRIYQDAGFVFHSEICIWKDPVVAMQRTKALGLLYKQLRKDSTRSRQGVPDYVIVMRKPGDNAVPVEHNERDFPVEMWQRYASPVWVSTSGADEDGFKICRNPSPSNPGGIDQSDTLQARSAREHDDEKHLCPLQLEVIRRAVKLWSNPGEVVWSPFMGIGSEGVTAIEMGRKFIGAELKASYYRQAVANLRAAESQQHKQGDLFSSVAP